MDEHHNESPEDLTKVPSAKIKSDPSIKRVVTVKVEANESSSEDLLNKFRGSKKDINYSQRQSTVKFAGGIQSSSQPVSSVLDALPSLPSDLVKDINEDLQSTSLIKSNQYDGVSTPYTVFSSLSFKLEGALGLDRLMTSDYTSSFDHVESPSTNTAALLRRLEERIQHIESTIGQTPTQSTAHKTHVLDRTQDPYGFKRKAAEKKLYTPLNVVELGEIEKVTSHIAKPTLQTSVLLLRLMFQKFVDRENREDGNEVNLIDLIIHIALCEYRLYRQFPMIPEMIAKLRKVLPVIDNSHYLDGYINSIGYKARKIVTEKENITKYIDLMEELQMTLPILDDSELVNTVEQADRLKGLNSEVDELNDRMRKLEAKIQGDLLRFEVANKIHRNVATIKSTLTSAKE